MVPWIGDEAFDGDASVEPDGIPVGAYCLGGGSQFLEAEVPVYHEVC